LLGQFEMLEYDLVVAARTDYLVTPARLSLEKEVLENKTDHKRRRKKVDSKSPNLILMLLKSQHMRFQKSFLVNDSNTTPVCVESFSSLFGGPK
jgi:hypothetical protein